MTLRVPLKEGDAAEQDISESLVFESGRPILVFPDDSGCEASTSLGSAVWFRQVKHAFGT
jgi:hypothetical protein